MVHDDPQPAAPAAPAPAPAAEPAAPSGELNLHDFVLNLLRDPSAQQAFDLDPTGCLKAAGLHDITPGDVHDVIPLVTDLVRSGDLSDMTSSLTLDGAAGLDDSWVKAEGTTPLAGFDGAGEVSVDDRGVGVAGYTHVVDTAVGDFGVGGEFQNGEFEVRAYPGVGEFEAGFADGRLYVDDATLRVPSTPDIDLADQLNGLAGMAPSLPGLPDLGNVTGMVPGLAGAGLPDLDDVTGIAGHLPVSDLTGAVSGAGLPMDDVTGAVSGVGLPNLDGVTGVAHGLPGVGDLTGLASGVGLPQLDDVTGLTNGLPGVGDVTGLTGALPGVGDVTGLTGGLPGVGDLTGLAGHLPLGDVTGALPETGELAKGLADPTAAASALAGAVPALPVLPQVPGLPGLPSLPDLTSHLPVEVPQLPALPALPTDHVNHAVDAGQEVANQTVDGAQAGQLPDLGSHLPQLPIHLPQLPVELPHLPVHLPQLPIDVPQLPNLPIGDASGHSVVGDVVDQTGLGHVINNNPVTDAVHDLAPDLHLGL